MAKILVPLDKRITYFSDLLTILKIAVYFESYIELISSAQCFSGN